MPEVSPRDAYELIGAGAQVVDVRTDVEFAGGHIAGSRHIPLADLQSLAPGLDRDKPLVLYCRSGDRSELAADAFAASGWDAHSIEGGLVGWVDEGLELDPEGGSVVGNPNLPPP
jgi:rhodanese-related sulfurtransferase